MSIIPTVHPAGMIRKETGGEYLFPPIVVLIALAGKPKIMKVIK